MDNGFKGSGFGPFDPIRYISRDIGVILINNALNLHSERESMMLWNEWSGSANIMPVDKLGQFIFTRLSSSGN
jgi:hypothetical protein